MLKTLRQSETGAGSFDRLKTQTLIEVVMTLVYSDVMRLVQETLVEDLARPTRASSASSRVSLEKELPILIQLNYTQDVYLSYVLLTDEK